MTDTDTLRKLAEAATPGPWEVSDKSVRQPQDDYLLVQSPERWICLVMDGCILSEEDAAFIAAANPTALIELVDEIDALRAKVKAQEDEIARLNGEVASVFNTAAQQVGELRAKVKALQEALIDASECVADWGAYAGKYFQEKHDLEGEVSRIRRAAQEAGNEV